MPPILNQSQTSRDALTGAGLCGSNPQQGCRRLSGALRIWHTFAVPGDLAVGEAELRGSSRDRSDVRHSLHRGQLEDRKDRKLLVRCADGRSAPDVRLQQQPSPRTTLVPQPGYRLSSGTFGMIPTVWGSQGSPTCLNRPEFLHISCRTSTSADSTRAGSCIADCPDKNRRLR